jgi:Zn-dependent peptidase ImmA (M78 family)
MQNINPKLLVWARKTAGLSPEDAAHKLGIGPTRQRSPSERIVELESGLAHPSMALLRRMAKQYRRPLVSFYLSAPPARGERGEDFRSLPEAVHRKSDPLVEALLRDIKARQDMVRELLKEDRDFEPLTFVASCTARNVSGVADSIMSTIGFKRARFRESRTIDQAFDYLRRLAEARGVFVLLAGNLGSHHTAIDVEVFRGFALADKIAPFVVINDQDAKSAWSFTLLHELAHIWVGQSGVSGARTENAVERFCSDVASQILLPDLSEFFLLEAAYGKQRRIDAISQFARDRRISASMVAYRLHLAGNLSLSEWQRIASIFKRQWAESRDRTQEKAREAEGGPNYYVVKRHRVGPALLSLVSRSISEGSLTPTKAAKVLGVKPRGVAPLLANTIVQRAA